MNVALNVTKKIESAQEGTEMNRLMLVQTTTKTSTVDVDVVNAARETDNTIATRTWMMMATLMIMTMRKMVI